VVSTAALIEAGQDVDQRVACPSRTVVDGKRFKNYEFSSLPRGSTFADALAASCNTTVVDRAGKLSDDALHDMAEQFGVGAEWDLPLPSYSGSVPVANSLVDRAASMIGQGPGGDEPLGMAMVAAAVASGEPRTPSWSPATAGAWRGRCARRSCATCSASCGWWSPTGPRPTLRGLPGDVAAKTGTAEYGDELPLRTHGWMIGYRGNLAFACLVVDGDGGNSDAGPVVRAFLREAPRSW
jgi:cell division protein FtsI/penicillin-binding protein 2